MPTCNFGWHPFAVAIAGSKRKVTVTSPHIGLEQKSWRVVWRKGIYTTDEYCINHLVYEIWHRLKYDQYGWLIDTTRKVLFPSSDCAPWGWMDEEVMRGWESGTLEGNYRRSKYLWPNATTTPSGHQLVMPLVWMLKPMSWLSTVGVLISMLLLHITRFSRGSSKMNA